METSEYPDLDGRVWDELDQRRVEPDLGTSRTGLWRGRMHYLAAVVGRLLHYTVQIGRRSLRAVRTRSQQQPHAAAVNQQHAATEQKGKGDSAMAAPNLGQDAVGGTIEAPVKPVTPRTLAAAAQRMATDCTRWVLGQVADAFPICSVQCNSVIIRHRMRTLLGYEPHLQHPKTYNEKIAWRMLYDHNPLIALTSDKIAARDYVASKVGPGILIPLIGVFERADNIPWEALPDRFALKASHGSGMNMLVRSKAAVEQTTALRKAEAWLQQNYYGISREWGYRDIRPRLLVEELLVDKNGYIPADVKVLVFNGRAEVVRIHLNRFSNHCVNFYDRDLRLLPVRQIVPTDSSYEPTPEIREAMSLAERIGQDFDYVRVDLYVFGGEVRFGEITHYDGGGHVPFIPVEYDRILGDMWLLRNIHNCSAPSQQCYSQSASGKHSFAGREGATVRVASQQQTPTRHPAAAGTTHVSWLCRERREP